MCLFLNTVCLLTFSLIFFLDGSNLLNIILIELVHAKLFNAIASAAPAPGTPFSYNMHHNVNASGNSQQSPAHPVSIVMSLFVLFVMIECVYGDAVLYFNHRHVYVHTTLLIMFVLF